MLVLILIAEIVLAIFLSGVLGIALMVTMRHGDPSATFRLFAVRDGLIDASVFGGVPRDNSWLETLYENVNTILIHSNLLGGPKNWPLAVAVGQYQASNSNVGKKLLPLPSDQEHCPEQIRVLGADLRSALKHLSSNHMGLHLQMTAREREQRRLQQQKAKALLEMINTRQECTATAAPCV